MRKAIAAALLVTPYFVAAQKPVAAAPSPPNVVIIMSDDQRWDTVNSRYMPRLTGVVSVPGPPSAGNPSVPTLEV